LASKHRQENPSVTIYITNYNYGAYLEQAIQSVLNQTFTDYELIIIDDGSTDDSKDIIGQYQKQKNVYTVFQENRGLNASNNIALNLSRGKYIIRLDADDYFVPQAIELMVSELNRNQDHALVFPDYYHVDEKGNIIEEIKRHDFTNDVSLYDQPAHGACTMIRTEILKSIGGYDEEFNRQDGYDIWLKISRLYSVKNISLPLFYYRQHQKSITKNEDKLFETRTRIIEKNLKKKNYNELNVLAIIPVRGNEIDPNSNPLQKIGKKCLIEWTIDATINSKLLQNIAISSNDNELKEFVSTKWGNKVKWVERDQSLSAINTSIEKTAIDTLKLYEKNNKSIDEVMMLYIEYPFRSTMYIDQAIHMLQLYDVDSVSSVRKDDDMFYIHSGHG
jgi:glycosyltransferase involved in cell wall biosynthesis